MSWISDIFTGGAGKLIGSVGKVIDNLHTSDEEKSLLKIKMEELLQKRDSEIEQTIRAELGAKERVLVAELQQGDKYTKRARPSVVYYGLIAIAFNYSIVPAIQLFMGTPVAPFDLPSEFWLAWGGIVGTWSIGRSIEKRGVRNKAVSAITGSKLL